MAVIKTHDGNIFAGKLIADTRRDFITEYLDCYSWDEQVALSNDIAVVIEVVERGEDPYEYTKIPENKREYSNAPFDNVMQYVTDLCNIEALHNLQEETDTQLFERAKKDYLKSH